MFSIHKSDTGAVPPWEYLPAQPSVPGEYVVGQMLVVQELTGQLSPIQSASKTTPHYMCMRNVKATSNIADLPVIRVSDDVIYCTTLSADVTDKRPGSKLQISAGGLEVDGAAVGTFEVLQMEGTTAGSTVYGRFV